MIVFNYIPIYGIIIAFKNYTIVDTVSSAPWVGLENFRIIMEDSFFWEAVRNTLAISLMKLFLGFAIPIILAVMIFEMRDGHLKKSDSDNFLYSALFFLDRFRRDVDFVAFNKWLYQPSHDVVRLNESGRQSFVRS
ncbi:hypothetical protein EfsSVR2330_11640 [Enterococcus faecalis]|nr:hypothetical protein EfsSVR2330_11640 [Enterococcus faecalis]